MEIDSDSSGFSASETQASGIHSCLPEKRTNHFELHLQLTSKLITHIGTLAEEYHSLLAKTQVLDNHDLLGETARLLQFAIQSRGQIEDHRNLLIRLEADAQ